MGERLAVLLNHAIEDQTTQSARAEALDAMGADARAEARDTISTIPPFEGARVVDGSRSWIRSQFTPNGLTVRLVELIEVPGLGTPGEPFRFWSDSTVVLRRDDGQWWLHDFQRAVASESVEFSERVWRTVMNSGQGWRHFKVA